MISTTFRLIVSSNSDADEFICNVDLPTVPTQGEVVNVEGEPYIVHSRAWSVYDVYLSTSGSKHGIACFIRLSPLQGPKS